MSERESSIGSAGNISNTKAADVPVHRLHIEVVLAWCAPACVMKPESGGRSNDVVGARWRDAYVCDPSCLALHRFASSRPASQTHLPAIHLNFHQPNVILIATNATHHHENRTHFVPREYNRWNHQLEFGVLHLRFALT
jgi:hypothetical protein